MICCLNWLLFSVFSLDTLVEGDRFHYEEVWGGIINRGIDDDDPDFDPNANFGFVVYNDHHFHLGYWIYALAYYSQFYPDWADGQFLSYD